MNVVSQFTVYDSVLGDLETLRPWQYRVLLDQPPRRGSRQEEMEIPGLFWEEGLIQLSAINNFLY